MWSPSLGRTELHTCTWQPTFSMEGGCLQGFARISLNLLGSHCLGAPEGALKAHSRPRKSLDFHSSSEPSLPLMFLLIFASCGTMQHPPYNFGVLGWVLHSRAPGRVPSTRQACPSCFSPLPGRFLCPIRGKVGSYLLLTSVAKSQPEGLCAEGASCHSWPIP